MTIRASILDFSSLSPTTGTALGMREPDDPWKRQSLFGDIGAMLDLNFPVLQEDKLAKECEKEIDIPDELSSVHYLAPRPLCAPLWNRMQRAMVINLRELWKEKRRGKEASEEEVTERKSREEGWFMIPPVLNLNLNFQVSLREDLVEPLRQRGIPKLFRSLSLESRKRATIDARSTPDAVEPSVPPEDNVIRIDRYSHNEKPEVPRSTASSGPDRGRLDHNRADIHWREHLLEQSLQLYLGLSEKNNDSRPARLPGAKRKKSKLKRGRNVSQDSAVVISEPTEQCAVKPIVKQCDLMKTMEEGFVDFPSTSSHNSSESTLEDGPFVLDTAPPMDVKAATPLSAVELQLDQLGSLRLTWCSSNLTDKSEVCEWCGDDQENELTRSSSSLSTLSTCSMCQQNVTDKELFHPWSFQASSVPS
ncbi:uncharacterized protein VTP21DRAFT_6753 [Calcarisporiella thermophila]|uniref:uncharacterized protein n=1 Tax=Calcarisporiella thermophila TaxID=911321 RepID=UPI00374384CD